MHFCHGAEAPISFLPAVTLKVEFFVMMADGFGVCLKTPRARAAEPRQTG